MNAFTTQKEIQRFFEQFKLVRYKKHEVIIRADDIPTGVYYVKKGYARSYSLSKDGEELTIFIFRPGSIFPLRWAINNSPIEHTFETITSIEVYRAPRDQFIELIKSNPDIVCALIRRILTRTGSLIERMEHLAFGNAYEKVAGVLLSLTHRLGQTNKNISVIKVPLTHKDIASLVGITRETASIELGRLKEKKIINYRGKNIVIKSLRRLKEECL